MNDKIYFSEKLKLRYKIKYTKNNEKRVVFEDNVNYNENEMRKIKKVTDEGLNKIHKVKKIFEGVII